MSLAVTHTQGSLAASCSTSQLAAWKGSLTKAKSSGRSASADSPAVWQRQYRHWLICSSKCHSRHLAACALGAFLLRRSRLRHCQIGGAWVGTGAKCRGAPGQISAQAQMRLETVACKALAVAPSQHQYDLDTESTSNAVELHEASVRVGGELLLDSVGLKVPHGSRAVIVGPNGSGKTTLLSVIAGLVSLAEGQRLVGARSLGWLRQEAISGSSRTVLEEAEAASQAAAQKAALAAAEANLTQDPENTKLLEAYDAALLAAESSSGSTTVTDVLEGLGFTESDFNRPCSELSGGWQMRVALARALLSEPELLLLDEPTNHMDSNAKRWLTSYLANSLPSSTTLLLVTHDRFLLEDFRCSLVVEIHEKILSTFRCQSIGEWEQRRIKQVLDIEKEVKKLVTKIETDKEWIQRNKAKASTARQAQSRMKKVDKMEEELWAMKEQLRGLPSSRDLDAKAAAAESLEAEATLPLSSMARVVLKLPDAPLMHDSPVDNVLLSLSNATIGYNPDEPVLQKITMALGKGDRVVLLGPNGCGKSTLLRTLAGALDPIAGTRKVGVGGLRRARVQLFTQDLAQDLPGEMTPIDYVAKDAPAMLGVEGIRRALGALGLRSQVHMSPISTLSGGEKARVAMAKFTTRPSDVLLLDEPTNHLDGPAVVALSEGLQEHVSGAIVVATHDRAFIEALQANQTATVYPASRGKPGSIRIKRGKVALEAVGGAPPNLQRGACGHTSASQAPKDEKIEAPRTQVITRKQVQKQERRHERKISRHMDKIEKAEAALEKLTEKLGGATETDPAAVKEYQALTQKVEKLYEVLYSIDAGRK